jgi:antirestriction protein ArdC/DNA polymerase III epsilon subunit-like protein
MSNSEMASWLDSYYKNLGVSEKPSKNNQRVRPQDLKPGDEVYIPGVGWRIVKSVSERKFDTPGVPSIWSVEYTDGNPRYPTTGTWKTMKGWRNDDGTPVDDSLFTRDPLGVPGDETPSSQQIVRQGEIPEPYRTPVAEETPTPEAETTPEAVPDQIAGLPAGTRATSKDLKGRSNIWIKQEDGSWVNIKTGEIVDELPIPRKQIGGSEWWNDYEFTAPEDLGGEEVDDEDDSDLVDEALIDTVTGEKNPSLDELIERVQRRKKLTRAERRAFKKEKRHRQQMMIKIVDSEFGQDAFTIDFPRRAAVRQMLFELDALSTEEMEDVSRVVNAELGWEFIKNLPYKPEGSDQDTSKPQEDPGAETYVFPPEEKPSPEEVPTAEEEKPAAEEEKPAPLTERDKEILKALVDKRRKIQRKIDKADLSEETTPAQRKALKDELDAVTKIIDDILNNSKPAEKPEESPAAEVKETEKPQGPQPSIVAVRAPDLKPGDVIKEEYFTIIRVETGLTKERDMDIVPATRLVGYYPNSVEQNTKIWADDIAVDVYRGVTPPSMGDLPVLSKPEMKKFSSNGRLDIIGTFKRKDGSEGKKWGLKNPADKARYDEAMAEYRKEYERRKAMWEAPKIETANNENANTPVKPVEKASYVLNIPASQVQVGDIAFRKNKDGAREFFTVTKVLGVKDGVASLEGHYVGHQTQVKEWREATPIDIIRGEVNLPASGDKEPLDRPDKSLPNYSQLEKERQEKIAEADKGYTFNAEGSIEKVSKPRLPAFYGSAESLLDLGDGTNIQEALDARENGYITFDFETLGNDVQNVLNPDAPIQAAAVRYVGGKKVEELNIYINPEKPLGDYYYEEDKDGNKVLRPDRMRDAEGNPITDEWLATQPSIKEQLQKLVDFFGSDPILVGQNVGFDLNVLQRWAQKVGIDFELKGSIDTLPIAQALQKIERRTVTFPENPEEGDQALSALGNAWTWTLDDSGKGTWKAPSNSLKPLAERLGVPTGSSEFHNALFDVEMTEQVLRKLLEMLKAGEIPTGASAAYAKAFKKWVTSLAEEKKRAAKREADKIVSEGYAGENVAGENVDSAIDEVGSVEEEPVTIIDGEESSDAPYEYTSPLYNDKINEEWVKDPENTDFIPNARVKDLRSGDFIFSANGDLLEVIKFADDETQPADFKRVFRANLNTGQIVEGRQTPREDGGTGWFVNKKLEGGIYRRRENADKTTAQIETETIEATEDVDPIVIPEVQPVKGEEVTTEQVATVVNTAIDEITTSKPDASIEEAVKGLNVDETIKEAVLAKPENAEGETGPHISADGVTVLKPGDKVINVKNKRTGVVNSILGIYLGKYINYVKVEYDDRREETTKDGKKKSRREPVSASTLSIVFRPDKYVGYKPKGETTVADISNKIKDIQGTTPTEGAVNPDELAERYKAAEKERDNKVKETNFVKTSSSVVAKIRETAPTRGTTESSLPSLKTGNLFEVNFVFDKPTAKELEKLSPDLNLDSEEDLIVFRAGKDGKFLRNQAVATVKPDGSIIWQSDTDKRSFSLELQRVLEDFESPVTNISAMAIMPEPEDLEGTDEDNYGNGTLLGESESTFDYNNISKFPPTEEQRRVVDAVMAGKDVVVQALAGSGKTSTLVLAAKRLLLERPDKKLLYIVFNKETAEEALGRMPKNVDSRTMDNIVYSMLPDNYKDRNVLNDSPIVDGRSVIGIKDPVNLFEYYKYDQVPLSIRGVETNFGRQELVEEIQEAVNKFAISSDEVISEKHFAKKTPYFDSIPPVLIEYANRMWKDVSTPEGWDPTSKKISKITYAHMLKAWALTKPQFIDGLNSGSTSVGQFKDRKNSLFFFDEAQDMNPVIVKLLADQKGIQKVYVGDSNQAIYAFRGAVDELNNVKDAVELYLTRTFRFGPKIAGIGNRFLTLLKSKNKIVGKPGEDTGEIVENMKDYDVIIARTNGGVIDSIFDMLAEGKNPGLNLETYYKALSYAKSAQWLISANKGTPPFKKPKMHEDLAGFNNWNEVLKALQDGKSLGGAGYMVRLLRDRKLNIKDVIDKLNSITPIRGTGFRTDEYVPLGMDAVKVGTRGSVGKGKLNSGFKGSLDYVVKDGSIEFENAKSYQDFLLKDITWVDREYTKKDGTKGTYKVPSKTFAKGQEEEMLTLINDISRWVQNYPPRIPIDAEVITAHKSKGKEWPRVKLHDDFAEPEVDDEGEMQLPDDEENRVSYVAVTRAIDAIDIGDSLKWIFEFTSEDDEKPEMTEVENLLGMSVIPDPEPVTPEEIGNKVIKDRKITDAKTLEVANKLIELIAKGVVPWTKGWTGGKLTNPKTNHAFQGSNVLALWAAMSDNNWSDPRFLNIKQVNAMGGRVIKGSKGTTILKPNKVFKDVKQPDGTLKKEGYVWFSTEAYFNVAQVTGIDFPPVVQKEPVPILDIETQILESYKDHPEIINRFQDKAFYRPSEDKIYLPLREQFDSSQAYIETLFHELGHSTGHISRLGKDGKRKDLQDNYGDHKASRGEEELIAEITVALIAAEFGVEIDWGNTASYAEGWLKPLQDDPGMIIVAARQAQAAVNHILGIKTGDDANNPAASFPDLIDYIDGGSGGLVGSRSTVGFVSTEVLKDMAGNTAGNEEAIENYRKSLREGKGFTKEYQDGRIYHEPIMVIYDNETGLAYVGEGNHRLQAAIAENIPYVPVRVVRGNKDEMVNPAYPSRTPKQIKNNKDVQFPETTGNTIGEVRDPEYTPPSMHPSYVFDKEFISDVVPNFRGPSDPFKPQEAGEGVGSEGKTGEQIAEAEPVTPEVAPEPNVGEQGQTGEEIASKAPKNKDVSVEPTKVTFMGEEYDLWNDITYDRESKDGSENDQLEYLHGIFADRLLNGQELVTDRNEINNYITEILKKYGYGNKFFMLASGAVSNKVLGKDPMKGAGGVEAGVGRANNDTIPDDSPLKNVEFPVFLARSRGISKIAMLHEIAHLMEAGWRTGLGGGHNQIWHQTFLTLLRQEGFQTQANLLSSSMGEVKGDTGAINP